MLDQATLEELYTELERPLYNVVYRWLWNPEDARDVVQDAFVRLWRMRERVEPATVTPLVFRIAVNLASNRRRARRVWRWVSLESARASSREQAADLAIETRQRRERVRRAVEALPEKLRRVVALTELSGMTQRDVAEALGIPPGTVASRKHEAMKRLERALAKGEDHDGSATSAR